MTGELQNRQGDLAFELLDLASVLTLDSGEVDKEMFRFVPPVLALMASNTLRFGCCS
jgi:hypothetical protein